MQKIKISFLKVYLIELLCIYLILNTFSLAF